jgi:hypothetical protein
LVKAGPLERAGALNFILAPTPRRNTNHTIAKWVCAFDGPQQNIGGGIGADRVVERPYVGARR